MVNFFFCAVEVLIFAKKLQLSCFGCANDCSWNFFQWLNSLWHNLNKLNSLWDVRVLISSKITHIYTQEYFGHCQISMTELFSQKAPPYMLTRFLKNHSNISVTKYIFYTNNDNVWSICRKGQSSEAVTRRFPFKKMFRKVSQKSVEKTCVGVSL